MCEFSISFFLSFFLQAPIKVYPDHSQSSCMVSNQGRCWSHDLSLCSHVISPKGAKGRPVPGLWCILEALWLAVVKFC